MQLVRSILICYRCIAGFCGMLWIFYGCSVLGPQSIANGRAAYNEVINRTEDQQLLTAIVRNRYGETISMLAVTNVTANIRFAAGAGADRIPIVSQADATDVPRQGTARGGARPAPAAGAAGERPSCPSSAFSFLSLPFLAAVSG